MSKFWTKDEEKFVVNAMGGKLIMLKPKAKQIANHLKGRTPEAVQRHWLVMRGARKKGEAYNPLSDPKAPTIEIMRALRQKEAVESLVISPNIIKVVKLALYTSGLRGPVTIDLGP